MDEWRPLIFCTNCRHGSRSHRGGIAEVATTEPFKCAECLECYPLPEAPPMPGGYAAAAATADLEQLVELSRARDTRNRERAGQRGRRAVVSEPPVMESRTAWFHDADPSAALHAAASWLHEHDGEGNLQAVIVDHSTLDAAGHSCGYDEEGAIWQTSIGVVQER